MIIFLRNYFSLSVRMDGVIRDTARLASLPWSALRYTLPGINIAR